MIKIDKNVPLPKMQSHAKYPFMNMDIGESFFVNKDIVTEVRNAAHMIGKRKGLKFTVRKISEGYRCWRVE